LSFIGPVDIERLQVRIAALIDYIEFKTQWRQDTLRDLLRVGEMKVCMEFISSRIADENIDIDLDHQQEFVDLCQKLSLDESYYL
jgi:hypothetical protein